MVYQGRQGDLIKAAVDQGAKGIVIASAGAGATSGTQGEGIQYARREGRLRRDQHAHGQRTDRVRAAAGGPPATPADARPEPNLRIAAEDLAPVKARILLMLALAAKADGAEIQRMFTEY